MTGQIFLIGAVRGLVSEGELVVEAIKDVKPNIIGLSISTESIQAMAEHLKTNTELPEPANFEEEMYIEGLSEFGEVIRPPPCFSEAWKLSQNNGTILKGLDMDDEHFSSAFCKYINSIEMIRQGRCNKKWARHGYVSETPQEFVLEWDNVINWLQGYKNLELARERWIAKGISKLSEKHEKVLAIVEFERFAGVKKALDELECDYHTADSES